MNNEQWAGVTHGGTWGQRMLMRMLSKLKPKWLYGILALVVPFYLLFNRKAYRAINGYFRKQWGYSSWKAFCKTYQNHFIFGQCMFDKFAVYAGKKDFFKLKITGIEDAEKCMQTHKGLIVATSHAGNFELAGYLFQMNLTLEKNPFQMFQQQNRPFHIIVHGGETQTILSSRKQKLLQNDISLTPSGNDMTHLFTLREALQKGEVVNITCDRFTGSSKSVSCHFLNAQADFPTSAFALAVHCEVPVLSVFCMKERKNQYHVYFKLLDAGDGKSLNANEKIKNYVQSYALSIEEMLKKYPEQWFNFYTFWKEE